jgi:hypothetical protein
MALTQLAKPEWQDYFDGVSKVLGAKLVEIEVTGLGLGDQVEVDWLPLIGLSYDPRGDVLAVIVEGIEHKYPASEADPRRTGCRGPLQHRGGGFCGRTPHLAPEGPTQVAGSLRSKGF